MPRFTFKAESVTWCGCDEVETFEAVDLAEAERQAEEWAAQIFDFSIELIEDED